MINKVKLKTRIFKGRTCNEVEEEANKWASKFIREERSLRTAYNEKDGTFVVECTCVEKESLID